MTFCDAAAEHLGKWRSIAHSAACDAQVHTAALPPLGSAALLHCMSQLLWWCTLGEWHIHVMRWLIESQMQPIWSAHSGIANCFVCLLDSCIPTSRLILPGWVTHHIYRKNCNVSNIEWRTVASCASDVGDGVQSVSAPNSSQLFA